MTNTITYSKLKRTIEKRIGKNDVWGIRPFLRAHYQSKKPGQGKEWKLDREMVESIINEFIGPKKKNDWARKLTSDLLCRALNTSHKIRFWYVVTDKTRSI